MPPPKSQSVNRRGFLATMAATTAAAGAFALLGRDASAVSASQGADEAAHATHNRGVNAMPNQMTSSNVQGAPTVELVHGAFAESSSWNGVSARLLAQGYPGVAAANPLRGVKIDADYVASILRSITGPIGLVGHSYGGSVITNAATGNGNDDPVLVHLRRARHEHPGGPAGLHDPACRREGEHPDHGGLARRDDLASGRGDRDDRPRGGDPHHRRCRGLTAPPYEA